MNKPMIGVTPLVDVERESLWMLPAYMEGIAEAGGIPVMLPLTDDTDDIGQLVRQFDGFLFTGGPDVSPWVYREERTEGCGPCCEIRDRMEEPLLRTALEANKPILGICRGIQLINAVLGGTLYQDLPTEHPSDTRHRGGRPYHQPVHEVALSASPLKEVLECESMGVNSLHHQAIRRLSPFLREMARSTDGLIEAVYMPEARFLWAVQWHPEFSYPTDEHSRRIFSAFVAAAR